MSARSEALARQAGRAARWAAVGIGASIPISTALDNVLVALLVLGWIASADYRRKGAAILGNPFALFACVLFAVHLLGAAYSWGSAAEVLHALDKAAILLLIPVLVSLPAAQNLLEPGLRAFLLSALVTLVLSYLLWFGWLGDAAWAKGIRADPVIFKLHITHAVLMAFAAFALAVTAQVAARPIWRAALWLFSGLAAFNVLFMVHGRTGQLVLLALFAYLLVSSFRWRGVLAMAVAGAALGLTIYLWPASAIHQRALQTITELEDWRAGRPAKASNMRPEAWRNSAEIVLEHPIMGVGTGGFPAAYAKRVEGTGMVKLDHAENQYLVTAVQLGVVGLAALFALFAAHWHYASRLAVRERRLARGLVLTMVVGCMFNSFLLDHTEALFYAWLSGLLFAGLRPPASRG